MKSILKLIVIGATLFAIFSFITGTAVPALVMTHEPEKQAMLYIITVLLSVGMVAVGGALLKVIDLMEV